MKTSNVSGWAKTFRFAASLLLALSSCALYAQDGKALTVTCVACHGETGNSANPVWPNIAGQKPDYLANQLKSFRDGSRTNAEMAPIVRNLSDEQIEQLANYYTQQSASVAANGEADSVAKGAHYAAFCVSCHGMRGQTANPEWPNLAGQQADYLLKQLTAFRDGKRVNGIMNNIVAGYSDERLKALAAYYSQLQP